MAVYDRQIAYISLMKNGVKNGNAGYVKWESDSLEHKLEIHIKGLYETDTLQAAIQSGDGKHIADISLKNGHGDYVCRERGQEIGIDKIPAYELNHIYIRIPGNRLLEADWINRLPKPKEDKTEQPDAAVVIEEENLVEEEPNTVLKETIELSEAEIEESKPVAAPYVCYENKWEQLMNTFEVIHPFENNRIFIKITPADFYILRETYARLSHNSFLLHGYYNYHYLILGKKESDDAYILGVPGIYHEREIMAAQMFGFEGFEPAKKECIEGSFGYYCVTVDA